MVQNSNRVMPWAVRLHWGHNYNTKLVNTGADSSSQLLLNDSNMEVFEILEVPDVKRLVVAETLHIWSMNGKHLSRRVHFDASNRDDMSTLMLSFRNKEWILVKLVFIRLIRLSRHFNTLQRLAALLTTFVLFRAFSVRLLSTYFTSILPHLIRVSITPLI